MGIPRLVMAAASYRKRFGTWPTELEITRATFDSFEGDLDPSQMESLRRRIRVTQVDEPRVIVSGPEGVVDYGSGEGFEPAPELEAEAEEWIRHG